MNVRAAARAGTLALAAGQAVRLAIAIWSAVALARGVHDWQGLALTFANQLPETVVVLACALFATGGRRGGLLTGLLVAVVELLRQVPAWLLIGLAGPGPSWELAAAAVEAAAAGAAVALFWNALRRLPAPTARPAGRGPALRLAWLAIAVEVAACVAVAGLSISAGLLAIVRHLPAGQEPALVASPLLAAALTLAPLLVASLRGIRRPTRLAIGLALAAQAAWALLGLAVAVELMAEGGPPVLGVAVAFLPPLAVAVLLLSVRPAPADNLSL